MYLIQLALLTFFIIILALTIDVPPFPNATIYEKEALKLLFTLGLTGTISISLTLFHKVSLAIKQEDWREEYK